MLMELQFIDELLWHRIKGGCKRGIETRVELARRGEAAKYRISLQHNHLLAGPSQQCGANHSVMTAADNDCVVLAQYSSHSSQWW